MNINAECEKACLELEALAHGIIEHRNRFFCYPDFVQITPECIETLEKCAIPIQGVSAYLYKETGIEYPTISVTSNNY